jgi:hypothetical protein
VAVAASKSVNFWGMTMIKLADVSQEYTAFPVYVLAYGISHSHCRENLISYIALIGWAL